MHTILRKTWQLLSNVVDFSKIQSSLHTIFFVRFLVNPTILETLEVLHHLFWHP